MLEIKFDAPVCIYFGKPGRSRMVSSVFEASYCLKSEKWPARNAPLSLMAGDALDGAQIGQITAAEAREAFIDAALEAKILVEGEPHDTHARTAFMPDGG
ncbi:MULTISPECIES: DUF982 domain-containing protein [unclassified Mesorhizobium]|uniref:DUF982 domain-containing protein n=1 Tax=unclassified Mesorhizobium TaxID=325217 RepID=UPI0003CE7C9A|nr:DUF982 domain-containing protein [Mesorhizobium sp. LSJC280B00]ESW87693.1 hypothetical protein X772_11290 [Mesorhizobium sp. LSJC280B00]